MINVRSWEKFFFLIFWFTKRFRGQTFFPDIPIPIFLFLPVFFLPFSIFSRFLLFFLVLIDFSRPRFPGILDTRIPKYFHNVCHEGLMVYYNPAFNIVHKRTKIHNYGDSLSLWQKSLWQKK